MKMKKNLKSFLTLFITVLTIAGMAAGVTCVPVFADDVAQSLEAAAESSGADLGNAALNTLLGLFTVFVVLIFISLIISQFKHINGISEFFKNRKTRKETVVHAIDNTLAQIEAKETVESDDMELIAVITAAISAITHKSADSFTVKSIKRYR